jgi:WD40 repeat protein/mono/diheme cytochrome c family protein
LAVLLGAGSRAALAAAEPTNAFAAVEAIFSRHCLDCHAAQDPEGKLVLETFETLSRGGESGPAFVQGKSSESLLVKMVEGAVEKDGKKKIMPPGKRMKLAPEEIASLKAWIDAGAPPPPATPRAPRELVLPKIQPKVPPRRSIQALAFAPGPGLLAVARYGEVDLVSASSHALLRTLIGHQGSVNAVAFSADGKLLAAAAGQPALFGEVRLWNVADGTLVRTFAGHQDALYAVAISPDGSVLATGSYDQKIKLWELATGRELQTLTAHNGPIFSLAFRPDGRLLASASGDRTIKLWQVATGKRVETLSQPLKEQYSVVWSPDGRRLAAAGIDNRIRVWEVSESGAETTNPLLLAKFAHEGPILSLVYSSDGRRLLSASEDRSLKVWEAASVTEERVLEVQPDATPGLAFLDSGKTFAVGRSDGSLEFYDGQNGQRLPAPAPELRKLEPRGLRRGDSSVLRLEGKNLGGITNVLISSAELHVGSILEHTDTAIRVEVTPSKTLARGGYDVSAAGPAGASGKLKIFVDDLPQWPESSATNVLQPPFGVWGALASPGEVDTFRVHGRAGETMVLDLAIKSVGSKIANGALSLLDEHGAVLAVDAGFDGGDRFLAVPLKTDGTYVVRVADEMLGASADHFYRLSAGPLAYVTGVFPLSVRAQSETDVQLSGVNLPPLAMARVKSGAAGELEVPIDPERFRAQHPFKVLVADGEQGVEAEPNNLPSQANPFGPGVVQGRIDPVGDVDLFAFAARDSETWILETDAARRGSPIDTRLEVLHPDGRPVSRLLLQAVRNTAINFRGVDANSTGMRLDNYEEMELNEYLYLSGEVMRLFRMPQGPDSEMLMYTLGGKRRAYFDTTAVGHALDEAGYIVEAHPVGTKLAANGLPVFTLKYENDDDSDRKLGGDSRLRFTAPTNGPYLVRLSDARGHGGERLTYRLVLRAAHPDFKISVSGSNPTVGPGSGQSFTIAAERLDGFEGEIRVELTGLPTGFTASSPIIIQSGHVEAQGALYASPDAANPEGTNATRSRFTATAAIQGQKLSREIDGLGTIKLGSRPKVFVGLEAEGKGGTMFEPGAISERPVELTIAPGQTLPARLRLKRNGHEDLVTFFAENLPHGVIVADIGLNGVLIPKGESDREIFFNAARWVAEQDRWFYMIEQQAGRQTSRPILLKVRKGDGKQTAGK